MSTKVVIENFIEYDYDHKNGITLEDLLSHARKLTKINFGEEDFAYEYISADLGIDEPIILKISDVHVTIQELMDSKKWNMDHYFSCRNIRNMKAYLTLVNKNEENNMGDNILMKMCRSNAFDMVKYLVENGLYVNYVGSNKNTPLHCCLSHPDRKIFNYLLDMGANINEEGADPILSICYENDIEFLLQNGAKNDLVSVDGKTLLVHYILYRNIGGIKKLLDSYNEEKLKEVLEKKFDDLTPLQICIDENSFEKTKLLMDYGADIEGEDEYGVSILNRSSNMSINRLLIYYGVNL